MTTTATLAVDHGLDEVCFPAPVPVGSKVRLTATPARVERAPGGCQVTVAAVIEREGGDTPVRVAEPVVRFDGG